MASLKGQALGRSVTLVLVDAAGALIGALPELPVPEPWWQEAADVVAGARERFGAVLRWLGQHAPGVAVPLLASDGLGRALLEHAPGGDAYGSPGLERERFAAALDRVQRVARGAVDELLARLRERSPRSEPERAIELLRPVVPLRQAAVFASWLPQIEATEHPYHALDVGTCLAAAGRIWRASEAR